MGRTKRRRSSATLDTKVYKHPAQPMVPSHVLERAAKRHLAKVEPQRRRFNEYNQAYVDFKETFDRRHQQQALCIFFDYLKEEIGEPLLMKLRAEACQEALIELEDSPSPGGKSYRAMHAQYFSEKRKQFYTRYRGYI